MKTEALRNGQRYLAFLRKSLTSTIAAGSSVANDTTITLIAQSNVRSGPLLSKISFSNFITAWETTGLRFRVRSKAGSLLFTKV